MSTTRKPPADPRGTIGFEPLDHPVETAILRYLSAEAAKFDEARTDDTLSEAARERCAAQASVLRTVIAHIERGDYKRLPEDKPRGIAAIMGQWPGDETDDEVAKALKEQS